ncbi:metallophosphoesterase [Sphingomonas sp.]|uniref:metallophosphoesterase n=1 Tax=Sphingomonas sp. TaxID=28214 RepID=UPI0035C87051
MLHFLRRFRRRDSVSRVPTGLRVFAVGDVHGRIDLLDQLLRTIDREHARLAPADKVIIFVGDLVDRGPHSRAVVERVRERVRSGEARLLMGNHEEVLIGAARGDVETTKSLLRIGGYATLESYGIDRELADRGSYEDLAGLLMARFSRSDLTFLERAEDMIRIGDYCFVHAGVRPGQPLSEQLPTDLRWIREPFISSRRDHGAVIVHGHTIAPTVENLPNRIGIDTGAYRTGCLSALVLEEDRRWFLEARGPAASREE